MKSNLIPSYKMIFTTDEKIAIQKSINKILTSGRLILGEFTKSFEKKFAKTIGSKYAIATNSGTSALEIIFRIIDVDKKDVLLPTNTNFATIIAAKNAGANAILYDSDLYPDIEDIKRLITKNTKVITVVHIGGYIDDKIYKIQELCQKNNIILVEDVAHAHGSRIGQEYAGTFGIGAFSFYPTKTLTTGEGGMITTNDEKIFNKAKIYRNQGKDPKNGLNILAGNSWRITEINAAMGIALLKRFESDILHRNKIIKRYYNNLKNIGFEIPDLKSKNVLSGYKCILFVKNNKEKKDLYSFMLQNNVVLARGVYDVPIHKQPIFKKMDTRSFPNAEFFAKTHVCLPIWRNISFTDVDKICSLLKKFKQKRGC